MSQYVFFKFQRYVNNVLSGNITICVPCHNEIKTGLGGRYDSSNIISNCPNYLFETTKFCGNSTCVLRGEGSGIGNPKDATEHIGEKWVLPSGRYVLITQSSTGITFEFYKADNTYIDSFTVVNTGSTPYYAEEFPSYTPISVGSIGLNKYSRGRLYLTSETKFEIVNGQYPVNNGSFSQNFWEEDEPVSESTDPYVNGGGSSGGGGGTGDFDDTSDTIGIPSLPTVSGLNTGFFTAFVCTQSQLQSVSAYLWNNVIDDILDVDTGFSEKIDALKKVVANPYDAIMGCSLVPVSPPTGGSKEMKMYGIVQTGISLPYASSRWVAVDCGTLNIHEFWGSYLDYSPYTKTTSLYLPYIGVVSVDIDLIMAKALQVVYHVDILSGICIAYIVVDGSVKFQYQGHCSTTIPITSSDYSGSIQAGLGLVGNVSNIVTSAVTGATGGVGGAVMGAVGSAISQAPSIASNVMNMKPDIKSGGGVGSSGGILGVQKPYLIIERPRQSVPERQNHFTGYPSNMFATIGSLSGYTEFERVNIDGITLTDEEKDELENILKGGVYL